ncbi:MAG: hypothetical protein AAGF93_02870 [Cyanobacteria bacterium P01_H01_bin.105]
MTNEKNEDFDIRLRCQICGKEITATLASCLRNWPICSSTPMSIIWMDDQCDVEYAINFAISEGRIWFEFLFSDVYACNVQAFFKQADRNCPLKLSCPDMMQCSDLDLTQCENFAMCLQLYAEIEEQPYDIVFTRSSYQ